MEPAEQREPTNHEQLFEAIQQPEFAHLINRRIIFNKNFARVKYAGRLQHEVDSDKVSKTDIWLGVEWEDESNGNTPSTVSDFEKASTMVW